jgi:hypothetical protein
MRTQLGVVPLSNAALPMNLRHCVVRSILGSSRCGSQTRSHQRQGDTFRLSSRFFCESPGRPEHGTESRTTVKMPNTEIVPSTIRESDCIVIRNDCWWQTRSYCNRESQVEVQTYNIAIHSRHRRATRKRSSHRQNATNRCRSNSTCGNQ